MESPREDDWSTEVATEVATDWTGVSNDFARDYAPLEEQHASLMQRWEGAKKRWLFCDREQSQNYSRQLKALNDHRARAEQHIETLQTSLKNAQNQNGKHKMTINRLKKLRQDREKEQAKQLELRKNEYCELECDIGAIKSERETLRRDLARETAQSATRLAEIGELKDKVSELELQNDKLQEELDIRHSRQLSMRKEIESQESQIVDTKSKLAASDETLNNIRLQMQKSCKLHQCSDSLRRLESMPQKFCNPSHLDFGFITDCGTLLCVECCPGVTDAQTDNILATTMGLRFEGEQCPWCFAEIWAWQGLEVPYSLAWAQEIEALQEAVSPT